jgi:hypothetical protein
MKQIDNSFIANMFSCLSGTLLNRTILFVLLLCIPTFINGQRFGISVSFNIDNFKIEKVDSFCTIQTVENNDIRYLLPAGYPKLPYIPLFVLLPHNSRIESILIDDSNFEIIKGLYNIVSGTHTDDSSDSGYFADTQSLENNKKDNVKNYYPSDIQIVKYDSPELYAGFLINKIYICPFKYFPETRQLCYYTKLLLNIQYQIDEKPMKYELSADKVRLSREFIRDMVINKEEIDKTVPLEEKIDYSKIQIYKETEEDSVKANKQEISGLKKAENTRPFYIKRLKTK